MTGDELLIKATLTGITLLKKIRYRQRYKGSKRCAVSISGKLYPKKTDLDKVIKEEYERWKGISKKKPALPSAGKKINDLTLQISHNLSTDNTDISPIQEKLSTPRMYKVKKSEIRQRILGYINTQKGKKELYFWTVSFFKGTPDIIAYRALNTWLTSLRKYRLLHEYLWVAERQENGTIHFHIAIPHKMPVQRANAMMAGTLKTFAKKGLITANVYQCARYNGVDICKNRKTRRVVNFAIKKGSRALAHYLTKYVTKNDTAFTHLAWHNSRGYSALFTGVTFTIAEFKQFRFPFFLNRTRIIEGEYSRFVPWLFDPPPLVQDHLFQLNSYVQTILN